MPVEKEKVGDYIYRVTETTSQPDLVEARNWSLGGIDKNIEIMDRRIAEAQDKITEYTARKQMFVDLKAEAVSAGVLERPER